MSMILGLEKFFYPTLVKKNKKEVIESFDKSIMKEFYCKEHYVFFWRNIKTRKGCCGNCNKFNKKIHVPYMEIQNKEVVEMVKVKRSISIDDGKHSGKIVDVLERTEPYEYIDIMVEIPVEGDKIKIKYGCPTSISINKDNEPTTQLSKVLTLFGMNIVMDKEITLQEMKELLVGKKCAVLIENKTSKAGIFANIVSLKPV